MEMGKENAQIIGIAPVDASAFDGTAARKMGEPVRIIAVDRRNANRSATNHELSNDGYTLKDDLVFAFRSLGISELVNETKQGSLAGVPLKGATPKNVILVSLIIFVLSSLYILF